MIQIDPILAHVNLSMLIYPRWQIAKNHTFWGGNYVANLTISHHLLCHFSLYFDSIAKNIMLLTMDHRAPEVIDDMTISWMLVVQGTPVQTGACQSTVSSLAVLPAKPNRYSHSGAYTSCSKQTLRQILSWKLPKWHEVFAEEWNKERNAATCIEANHF